MNRASVWAANGGQVGTISDENEGGAEVVEAVLSWRDARSGNALGVHEVKAGGSLALGEKGDLMVPEEVLGTDRFEVVHFDGDTASATAPEGAQLRVDGWPTEERHVEIACGHVVEIYVGAFVLRLSRGREEKRPAVAPLELLRGAALGTFAGSAFVHAAVFAAIAFIAPSLGATEEDPYDRDRILLIQKLLNASAQREEEQKPDDSAQATGGDVNAGAPARGSEGAAGTPTTQNKEGRWAAKGTATPLEATLPREKVLQMSERFGIIGMLAAMEQSDPNAPTAQWGSVLNGSDAVSAVGKLYGGSIGDAMGTGGWGLSGVGEGGGGSSDFIGLGGIGGLGHTGTCLGKDCSGIGVGYGKPGGGYVIHRGPRMRIGDVSSNGRLPAEVIQRIVRLNSGRYINCYQAALRTNPSLEGRVTVRFVIGRDGSVQVASDGGSDIPDTGVRQCVVSSFTNLSFPQPDGGLVTVVYPIMFSPQ
jgi:hypothetical protein